MKLLYRPLLVICLLTSATLLFAQGSSEKSLKNPPPLPPVSAAAKLQLRDIQLQFFKLEQQVNAIQATAASQVDKLRKQEAEELVPRWSVAVEKAVKEAGLDPAKYSVDATGEGADTIKFVEKPKTEEAVKKP